MTRKQTAAFTNECQNGNAFKSWEFITQDCIDSNRNTRKSGPRRYWLNQRLAIETPCSPISQNFEHASPGRNQATEMAALRENYQQPAKVETISTVAADSQLVNCDRFSYKPVIRAPSSNADNRMVSDWVRTKKRPKWQQFHTAQL